ncbi:MAG: tetratricopeptide repeat protein [Planctomycetota bacterium]
MNIPRLTPTAAALLIFAAGGCTGHGRHTRDAMSAAELRMNQIRSATDWEMAESAFLAGDFDRAKEKLERSISLNPGVAKTHELLGRVHLERGDLAEARRSLLRASLLDPKLASAQYSLGIIGERLQDREDALARYTAAAELAPTDAVYALAVVETFVDLDQLDEADRFLDDRARSFAYDAGVAQSRGHLSMLRGNTEEAVRAFHDARLLDPDQPELIEDLARAQALAGQHAESAHNIESLLLRDEYTHRRDLRRQLARSYVELDRLGEARSTYLDIVADPTGAEDVSVWLELGSLAHDMNDTNTLGRAGRRLMALATHQPEGYIYRAVYYRESGKAEQASGVLEQAVERDSLNADGYVLLGLILADAGKRDEALSAFKAAADSDPDHSLASILSETVDEASSLTTVTPEDVD